MFPFQASHTSAQCKQFVNSFPRFPVGGPGFYATELKTPNWFLP